MDDISIDKSQSRHSLNLHVPPSHNPRRLSQSTISDSSFRRAKNVWRKSRRFPADPSLYARTASPHPEPQPQPRDARLQCDVDAVLAKVLPQEEENNNYPQFDSISAYVRHPDSIPTLLHNETTRLIKVAENPDVPLEFSSHGYFQSDTEDGYRAMSNVCQRILTTLTICLLDNECINARHCARMTNEVKLANYIRQVYKAQTVATDSSDRRYLAATYALVDYISAVLTRLIIQTSPGKYWQINVLSVLVKRITKIKVLLVDVQLNASVAARSADAVLLEVRQSGELRQTSDGMDEEEECEEYMRSIEANEKEGTASYEEKEVAKYCVEQNKFRFGLNLAVRAILTSMRFINGSGMPPTSFEIFAVAYETGFEGFKVRILCTRPIFAAKD